MDNWIAKRIRAVSVRRVVAWTLALAVGVLLATSDHRYLANFFRGPYPLARAELDSIRDVPLPPRYYARVNGEKDIDTEIRQYTVHTKDGVETSRTAAGASQALVLGTCFLAVRS